MSLSWIKSANVDRLSPWLLWVGAHTILASTQYIEEQANVPTVQLAPMLTLNFVFSLLSSVPSTIFYLLCQLLSSCRDFLPWITLTSVEGGSECPWDFGDCCLDCYFGGCCAGHMILVTLLEDEGSQRWSRQSPELWRDTFLSLLSRTASLGTHENYRYFSVL